MLTRRLIGILIAAAAFIGVPGVVAAQEAPEGGPNHVVQVENDVNQTMRARGGLKVGRTDSDAVTSENIAWARAHDCTEGCEARAAALQAVIVVGKPSYYSPKNFAVAFNENCTGCGSFAYAYQYVVQTDRRVWLSDRARDDIAELREEARDDVRADLPYAQIDANLADVALRFRAVIDREVERSEARVQDRESDVRRDRSGDR
jgi:hypothetical protein